MLTIDGTVQLSEADDVIYNEMAAHVPLLSRPFDAASVLIIGGGDGGMLREVLRHDFVRRVVMVDLDAAVVEVSRRHVRIEGDYDDPRVELVIDDGARWVPEAARRALRRCGDRCGRLDQAAGGLVEGVVLRAAGRGPEELGGVRRFRHRGPIARG